MDKSRSKISSSALAQDMNELVLHAETSSTYRAELLYVYLLGHFDWNRSTVDNNDLVRMM